MDERRFDEVAKLVAEGGAPTDEGVEESMPRRAALGLMGGLAGLAGLAAFAGSSRTASAQVDRTGQLTRVRQVIDSVNVPSDSNRVLNLVCPNPRSNERVFVMGGGFTHNPFRLNFAIRTSAPPNTRSWIVDGHNVGTGVTITLGGYAICAYFRT